MKKLHAITGVTRCRPPKSAIVEDLRRAIIQPATRNNAAVENPWLNIYSVAPLCACEVIAKIPIVMNPKCEIDV